MYYLEIVDLFDVIDDVIVQRDGKTVRVRGKKDCEFADYYQSYSYTKVAKEVAKRLKYFIGIKRNGTVIL